MFLLMTYKILKMVYRVFLKILTHFFSLPALMFITAQTLLGARIKP